MNSQIKPYNSSILYDELSKSSQAVKIDYITSDVANIKSSFANSAENSSSLIKKTYKKEFIIIALLALVLYMLMNTSNSNKGIIIARLSNL